jgi:putative nucleotidyltransferase with HDIG domain
VLTNAGNNGTMEPRGGKMVNKEEAEQLLVWANEKNPGAWANHSRVTARAAETIAQKCGLDTHRAYVSGLLHDIGRYEGVSGLRHVYAGYELLTNRGYDQTAEICLSHSFPYQNIGEYFGVNDCSPEEIKIIISFLSDKVYDEYDKLIQLCDAIGTAEGVSLIEVRVMDVIRRHGFTNLTLNKIEAIFALKSYFDRLCGVNIYNIFYDEIKTSIFG